MLRSITIVSIASLALAACGSSHHDASVLADASGTMVEPVTMRDLPAGDYLVRVVQPACYTQDLNLSQFNRQIYVQTTNNGANSSTLMHVELSVASVVNDGKVHTAICRVGAYATGVTRVTMDRPFTLVTNTQSSRLGIDSVWTFDTQPVAATEGTLLGAGTYLATISQQQECVASKLQFSKSIRDLGNGIEQNNFAVAGVIADNLPHPAICMMNPPRSTGTAIVRASAPSTKLNIARRDYAVPAGVTSPIKYDDTRIDAIKMVTALYKVR